MHGLYFFKFFINTAVVLVMNHVAQGGFQIGAAAFYQ